MGQRAQALMYGIPDVDGVDLFDYDEDEGGLVNRWESFCRKKIQAWDAKHPRRSWDDPRGEDEYVPRSPYESDLPAAGFYIACAGSGKAGIPYLEPCAIEDIPAIYGAAYKAAVKRWERFAKWAEKQGVTLPPARIYLTETETA